MSQQGITLTQEEIRKILPHQPPFVLIDEVFDLDPGKSGKAWKYIDPNDPIFPCHFPGNPIYPGIFLIEAAGQLSFVTFSYRFGSEEDEVDTRSGYLGTVKNFVFKQKVVPGMKLVVAVEIVAHLGNASKVSAKILHQDNLMAGGDLYFTIGEGYKQG